MSRRTAVVQFLAFVVVLGVPDGAIGVLWPAMRHSFDRPLGDLGVLALAGTVLYFLGGLVFAALTHRRRPSRLILSSCVVAAAAAAGWAWAGDWIVVLVAIAVFGLARGVLDAAVNASAADGIRTLGWMHAGWAVGGSVGPILVAALAGAGSWRLPVAVIAISAAAVSVGAAVVRRQFAESLHTPTPTSEFEPARPRLAEVAIVATFFVYTAAEIGPIAWGYVYLTEDRRLGSTAAAVVIASFWAGLTLGRVLLAVAGHRMDAARLLDRCCVVVTAATAVAWLGPTPVVVAAMPMAGLGFAAMFPSLVNLTPKVVGRHAGERVIGLSIAAAALGGPLAVLVEGRLAEHVGVASIGPCLFAFAVALLAVNRWLSGLRQNAVA